MKCSKYLAMQFKILHFILVTKEKLLQCGLAQDDICTFCEEEIETLPHIFGECEVTKLLWSTITYTFHPVNKINFAMDRNLKLRGYKCTNNTSQILHI